MDFIFRSYMFLLLKSTPFVFLFPQPSVYAIIQSLKLILNFASNNYLIASGSNPMSYVNVANYILTMLFQTRRKSSCFVFCHVHVGHSLSLACFCIKSLIFTLNLFNYIIHFLSIPSRIGIHSNEVANNLIKSPHLI